jgi:hypothetical protein
MFFGLLDPDPLVRCTDPDPAPSSKNSKKKLYFYCFVTSFWLIIFEKLCKCTFKKLISRKTFLKLVFCWRPPHWKKKKESSMAIENTTSIILYF